MHAHYIPVLHGMQTEVHAHTSTLLHGMQHTNLAGEQVLIVNLLLNPLHQLCNILRVWLRVSGVYTSVI